MSLSTDIFDRSVEAAIIDGTSMIGRTVLNVTSLVSAIIICVLFGLRMRRVTFKNLRSLGVVRLLVATIYISAVLLVLSLVINVNAFNISEKHACKSTIINCIVFWVLNKGCIYLFLLERVYAARTFSNGRTKDWVWLTGMGIIALGFCVVALLAIIFSYNSVTDQNICVIGFARFIISIIWAADVSVNVALSCLFFILLWPTIQFRRQRRAKLVAAGMSTIPVNDVDIHNGKRSPASESNLSMDSLESQASSQVDPVEQLLRKTVIGTIGQLLPTLANMIVMMIHEGHEAASLCIVLCVAEVTIQVAILHWMTSTMEHEPGAR